jgi:hypothetical protein
VKGYYIACVLFYAFKIAVSDFYQFIAGRTLRFRKRLCIFWPWLFERFRAGE